MEYSISDKVPLTIYSDEKRFKQLLFNLIGNSIKFTFQGIIKVILDKENDFLKVTIKDTGVGMKAKDLTKLFQNFGKLEDK